MVRFGALRPILRGPPSSPKRACGCHAAASRLLHFLHYTPPAVLSVEALEHVVHQQKVFMAGLMYKHPQERQHGALQVGLRLLHMPRMQGISSTKLLMVWLFVLFAAVFCIMCSRCLHHGQHAASVLRTAASQLATAPVLLPLLCSWWPRPAASRTCCACAPPRREALP